MGGVYREARGDLTSGRGIPILHPVRQPYPDRSDTMNAFRLNGTELTWTCKVCEKCIQRDGRAAHARKHMKEGTIVRRVTNGRSAVQVRFELISVEGK